MTGDRRKPGAGSRAPAHADELARASAILEAALDCIITMDSEGRVVEFNPAAERTFGYRRAQVIGRSLGDLIVPPELRERHRQGLARYLATGEAKMLGRRIEITAMRADGTLFPVELAIARIPGEGRPLFTAYLRDISERVRGENLRSVRFTVTQLLAQATGAAQAAGGVLRAVCEHLRWDFGAYWSVTREGELLECATAWTGGDPRMAEFGKASAKLRLRRGEGLPGRVWQGREPAWVLDVRADPAFPRAGAAAQAGLHSAFACALRVGERTIGVLEFFTQQMREPDAELLETMGTVAGQVGQLIERLQAEERLRVSEARFRALMDQAPISVQIFSPDGITRRVNAAWSELWGVTLEQIAGYNILEDPQLEEKGVAEYVRRAFAGEAVAIPPIRYDPEQTIPGASRHADPVRYVSAVAYPLKDEAGRVREVVLVHEDISARRRAELAVRESEERLRLLADTIPQLAWMAQPDGYIFWYNRRWYEYTGTRPEDMEGWGWQSVHDPATLPQVLERWKGSIASGEPFDMVFPLKGADGSFRAFLTRVAPLRDAEGSILYWFGTNTDVSEIKRMEEALREVDRRKDEFLATLAHELRNPLAPIVNALQILAAPSADASLKQKMREVMERQVRHLARLVDDLLDVSRVVRGKIELRKEPVALSTVIERAVETAQPLIDARSHRLEISLPEEALVVDADPVRLAQVVANLLTNSAKYTEPGGRIVVCARASGDGAVISVLDNGIGLAPQLLPHVFESFVQGDHGGLHSPGGLGIGLTLVKNLVDLHGGTVLAESEGPGKGARFTVRLPRLRAGQVPAAAASEEPAPAPRPKRILVVDDNRDAAESLAALLRVQANEVHVAYDGASAIEMAAKERPSVIFLDIGMPEMDGHETARHIRATPGLEGVVLVALTGWGQEADRKRSSAAGFDHHLVKPAEPSALRRILSAT